MTNLKIIVLGSGTSTGIPMIGCRCDVCTSPHPKNKRTRPCVMVEGNDTRILIDTPPELRIQLLQYGLDDRLDCVLITHTHADHIMGMDDIRGFTLQTNQAIPVYAEPGAMEDLKRVFRYVLYPYPPGSSSPLIDFREIEGNFQFNGITIEPLRVYHGEMPVLAFRIGDFAYVTDVSFIPPESLERLHGLKFLILDALRYTPHPTHFSLEQALEVVQTLKPERAAFTHLTHAFDHDAVNAELPEGVELAYDGMEVHL